MKKVTKKEQKDIEKSLSKMTEDDKEIVYVGRFKRQANGEYMQIENNDKMKLELYNLTRHAMNLGEFFEIIKSFIKEKGLNISIEEATNSMFPWIKVNEERLVKLEALKSIF
jgi:hypothetical protein